VTSYQLIAGHLLAHDLETDLLGGCGICDTEHDEMCAACQQCRCHRHDTCTRPAV